MALTCALSITGTALAATANSFADVPTNNWAYDAVTKLSKAGIVTGYDAKSFGGDKTLTRYEMAQIVANAITKEDKANAENKALIEKLATEFSVELDKLDARVTKVENQVDKLNSTSSGLILSGFDRIRYVSTDKGTSNPTFANRFDLVADTVPNNKMAFHFRDIVSDYTAMGTYPTGASGTGIAPDGNGSKTNQITDINITDKNFWPGVNITAGRFSLNLGQTSYLAGSNGGFDGINGLWKSSKGSLQVGYANAAVVNLANFNNSPSTFADVANIIYGEYDYQSNANLKFDVNFVKSQGNGTTNDTVGVVGTSTSNFSAGQNLISMAGGGFNWKLNKNIALVSDYWVNSASQAKIDNGGTSPVGYVARVAYKGNQPTVPGSWGAFVEYQKFQPDTYDENWTASFLGAMSASNDPYHGALKGLDVQFNTTLEKNFVLTALYAFNLKNSVTNGDYFVNGGSNFTRIQATYMF